MCHCSCCGSTALRGACLSVATYGTAAEQHQQLQLQLQDQLQQLQQLKQLHQLLALKGALETLSITVSGASLAAGANAAAANAAAPAGGAIAPAGQATAAAAAKKEGGIYMAP